MNEIDRNARMRNLTLGMQNAQKLMQMESSGAMNQIAKQAKLDGKLDYNAENEVAVPLMEQQSMMQQPQMQQSALPAQPTMMGPVANKLPKAILDEMVNNPIDTSQLALGLGMENQGSVLDHLGVNEQLQANAGRLMREQQPSQVSLPQSQPTQTVTSNIDYSLINTMIENCVKKYTKALGKKLLQEGKESASGQAISALRLGNQFQFITENGDLYEAKLHFVRNINKK